MFDITDVYIIHSFFSGSLPFLPKKTSHRNFVSSYLCFVGSDEGERYGSIFGQI